MSHDRRLAVSDLVHERARLLAAGALDEDLAPDDAAWLGEHIAACPECAAAVTEFAEIRAELRALAFPEPPRELWARTAAALDAAHGSARRARGDTRRGIWMRPIVGTAIAVAAVVVVAGASLLSQAPGGGAPGATRTAGIAIASGTVPSETGAPAAPVAFVKGNAYWIASSGGVYQIMGGSTDCAPGSGTCTVGDGSGSALGSVSSDSEVSAVVAPDASLAAVWTDTKIAIVTLSTSPQTVSLDLLTPRPTAAGTATPTPATATPASSADGSFAPATPAGSASPDSPPPASPPTATPATPTPATGPTATGPTATAILDGYEIVGRDPEFSADGRYVAFSARPADGSTGPDVFVWRVGDERASAVTGRHSDVFDGWSGSRILVGEFAPDGDGTGAVAATSYIYDPATTVALRVDRPMLIAAIDPTGTYIVYWAGAVEFDSGNGIWQPGRGALYYDRLANVGLIPASLTGPLPTAAPTPAAPTPAGETAGATPAATFEATPGATPEATSEATPASTEPAQPSAAIQPPATATPPVEPQPIPGTGSNVRRWVVRWDGSGRDLVVWTTAGAAAVGRLHLFAMVAGELVEQLTKEAVLASACFDGGSLVYTSADGTTFRVALAPPATPAPTPVPTESPVTPSSTATPEPVTAPAETAAPPAS